MSIKSIRVCRLSLIVSLSLWLHVSNHSFVTQAQLFVPSLVSDTLDQLTSSFKGLNPPDEALGPFDQLVNGIIPLLIGSRPNNENGTRVEFREYAMRDYSNDDARHLSTQELINRSGFRYAVYDAIADDGYITQLTRLINPLADASKLHQPPVILEHGGLIDPSAYLIASSIQHFPEKWPRTPEDPQRFSWNRSLAFTLANNGFDVWLAETRGSNEANRRRIKSRPLESLLKGKNEGKNMSLAEEDHELLNSLSYWSFSQDDLIQHELKSHIDAVMELTGSKSVHLMTFSLSTPTSLAFLSSRPDYARKIRGFISMAPIISGQGVNKLIKLMIQLLCPLVPDNLGTLVLTDLLLNQHVRNLLMFSLQDKRVRYTLGKAMISYFVGPSAKWQTLLDLNVIGHLARSLSFKEAKQLCQQTSRNRLQKFDYGPIKNQLLYNQTEPPVYDLSNLQIKDWIVVSAANDALSTPQVYEHLYELVNPKPVAHIVAPGFNHLDLIVGWENDEYVNLPIMRYLEQMSSTPGDPAFGSLQSPGAQRSARQLDLSGLIPPSINSMLTDMINLNLENMNLNSNNSSSSSSSQPSSGQSAKPKGNPLGVPLDNLDPGELLHQLAKKVAPLLEKINETLQSGNLLKNIPLDVNSFGQVKEQKGNKIEASRRSTTGENMVPNGLGGVMRMFEPLNQMVVNNLNGARSNLINLMNDTRI